MTVGDSFVQQKAVEFQEQDESLAGRPATEVFAYVNTDLRADNDRKIRSIVRRPMRDSSGAGPSSG